MLIDNIDIFCEVIDNYGDVGVAYRLARELKRIYPNKELRFIINQTEELNLIKKNDDIIVIDYKDVDKIEQPADLIIETFACNIPEIYMDKALKSSKLMINLEYFSSEDWVDDFHLQESFLGGNFTALLSGVALFKENKKYGAVSILLGIIGLVSAGFMNNAINNSLSEVVAIYERMTVYPITIWQLITGIVFLKKK